MCNKCPNLDEKNRIKRVYLFIYSVKAIGFCELCGHSYVNQ